MQQQTALEKQIQQNPLAVQTLVQTTTLPNGTIKKYKSFQELQTNNAALVNALPDNIKPFYLDEQNVNYAVVPMTVVHQGFNDQSTMKTEIVNVIVTDQQPPYLLLPSYIRTQALSATNAEMYSDAKNNICFFPDAAHTLMMKIPANWQNDFITLLPIKTVQPYTTLSQKMQQHHLQNNVQPNSSNNNKNPNPIYDQQYQQAQPFPQPPLQNIQQNYKSPNMSAINSFQMQNYNNNVNNNNFNFNNIHSQTNQNMINNNAMLNPVNQNYQINFTNQQQFMQQQNQQQLMQQQNAQAMQSLLQQINEEVPECIIQKESNGWKTMWGDNNLYPTIIQAQDEKGNNVCSCQIVLNNDGKPLTTDTMPPKILYKIRSIIDGTNYPDQDINGQDRLHTVKFNKQQKCWIYSNEVYNEQGQKLLPNVAVNTVEVTQADILQQPIRMVAPDGTSTETQDEASMNYVYGLRLFGKIQCSDAKNEEEREEQNKTLYLNLNRKLRELTAQLQRIFDEQNNSLLSAVATPQGLVIIRQIQEIRNILWRQYYCNPPIKGTLPGELPPADPRYRNITKKNQFLHDHILSNGINGYIPGYFEADGTYIEGKFRYYIPMINKFIEFTESDMNDFIEKQQVLVGNNNIGSSCYFNAVNVFLQSDHLKTMCLLKIGEEIFEKNVPINQASSSTTTHCTLKPAYKKLLSKKRPGTDLPYLTLALADYVYATYKGGHSSISPHFLRHRVGTIDAQFINAESNDANDYYRSLLVEKLHTENTSSVPSIFDTIRQERYLHTVLAPAQLQQFASSFATAGYFSVTYAAQQTNLPGQTTYNIVQEGIQTIESPPENAISNKSLNKQSTTLARTTQPTYSYTTDYHDHTQKVETQKDLSFNNSFSATSDVQIIYSNRGKNNVAPYVCSMPLYVENEGNYFELQNIVHWDPCGGIGHFMNYRKHPNGRWYKYSDSCVDEVKEEEVLKCLTSETANYLHSYGRVAPGRWKEKMEEQQQALLKENIRDKIVLSPTEADTLRKILIKNFGQNLTGLEIKIGKQTHKVSDIVDADWQMIFQKLHNIHCMTGTVAGRLADSRTQLATSPFIDHSQLTLNTAQEPRLLFASTFQQHYPQFGTFAMTRPPYWKEYKPIQNQNKNGATTYQIIYHPIDRLSNYEKCINAMKEAIRTNNPEIKVELYPIQNQQEPAQLQPDTKPRTFTIGQVVCGHGNYASLTPAERRQATNIIRKCYQNCKQQEKLNRIPSTKISAHVNYFSQKLCDLGVAQSNGNGTIKIDEINIPAEMQNDINKAQQKKPQIQPVVLPNQQKNITKPQKKTQQPQVIVPKKETNSPPYPPVEDNKTEDINKISKIVDDEDENGSDEQGGENDNNEQNYENGTGNNPTLPSAPTSNSEHNPMNNPKNTSKQSQPYGTKPPAGASFNPNNLQQSNNNIYNKPISNQNNTNVVKNNPFPQRQLSFNNTNSSFPKTDTKNTANNFTPTLTSTSTLQPHLSSHNLSTTQFTTPTKTSSTNNNSTSPNQSNNTTTQSTKTNTNANTTNTPLEEPSYVGDAMVGAGLGGATTGLGTLGMTKVIPIKQVLAVAIMVLGLAVMIGALIHGLYKKNKYEEEKQAHDNALHNLTTTNQQTRTPNTL